MCCSFCTTISFDPDHTAWSENYFQMEYIVPPNMWAPEVGKSNRESGPASSRCRDSSYKDSFCIIQVLWKHHFFCVSPAIASVITLWYTSMISWMLHCLRSGEQLGEITGQWFYHDLGPMVSPTSLGRIVWDIISSFFCFPCLKRCILRRL